MFSWVPPLIAYRNVAANSDISLGNITSMPNYHNRTRNQGFMAHLIEIAMKSITNNQSIYHKWERMRERMRERIDR